MSRRDALPQSGETEWPVYEGESPPAVIDLDGRRARGTRGKRAGPGDWRALTDDQLLNVVLDFIDRDPVHPGLSELFAAIRSEGMGRSTAQVCRRGALFVG